MRIFSKESVKERDDLVNISGGWVLGQWMMQIIVLKVTHILDH